MRQFTLPPVANAISGRSKWMCPWRDAEGKFYRDMLISGAEVPAAYSLFVWNRAQLAATACVARPHRPEIRDTHP